MKIENIGLKTIQKKWQPDIKSLDSILLNNGKIIYIASFIVINNNFFLLNFINVFFCLLAFPKLNTTNYFQFINILQLSFLN